MLSTPEYPILLPVVCENNEFVYPHTTYIQMLNQTVLVLPMKEEYVGTCFLVVQTVCEQPETSLLQTTLKSDGNEQGEVVFTMAFNASLLLTTWTESLPTLCQK